MTFRAKTVAGFGVALAILLSVAVFSYQSIVRTDEDRLWVTRTDVVLVKINDLLANASTVDSSTRSYILTGDSSYLAIYAGAVEQVRRNLQDLRDMTSDNQRQQRNLDALGLLVKKRFEICDTYIAIRKLQGLAAGADSVTNGPGNKIMADVQAEIAKMKQEENLLLAFRTSAADRSSRNTRIAIVAGNMTAICFFCIAGFVVSQEMKQRRQAEEQVQGLNTDLERRVEERTAELARQAKELARSNSELQQFAYVASHDLQEPLRMVASFTQLLAKRYAGQLDDDARDFINFAVDGATRMQTLISDLLNYSRVGTQGKPLEPTDSDAVLEKVLDGLKLAIEDNRASITHDHLPLVLADPMQLGQLFQNLLTNSMKFHSGEPPRIHISAHNLGKSWRFSFQDNGIGIAAEHSDRIFIIFQRLHTKTEYPGTGIGLAICKKIVERHGGRIWIEPTAGGGTTFNFTIASGQEVKQGRAPDELHVPAYAD